MWLSSLLFCPIVCCDARERSSYRVAVVFAVASGDQIVPSFFCPLPLRHPVSFCGSVTKTIWASGGRPRERQAGPFPSSLPPRAAIKLNCRSDGEGFIRFDKLALVVKYYGTLVGEYSWLVCMWLGEVCPCSLIKGRNNLHQTSCVTDHPS